MMNALHECIMGVCGVEPPAGSRGRALLKRSSPGQVEEESEVFPSISRNLNRISHNNNNYNTFDCMAEPLVSGQGAKPP